MKFAAIVICFIFLSVFLVSQHAEANCSDSYQVGIDSPLVLDLEKAVNIALSAQRRLGGPLGALAQAEISLELAESEFNIKYLPKGDLGYVGGGEAGSGATVGAGVEFSKKFRQGSRFSIFPSVMKAARHFESNIKTTFTQPLLRGFGSEYTLSPLRGAQFALRTAHRSLYLAQVRLILQTVQGLYEVAKQESLLVLEEESMERIKKFCSSTKMKERIGLCDALDVYRAEIELKRAEDSFNQALDRLQDAKDSLRDILALSLDQEIEINVPIDYEPVSLKLENALEIAVKNRIEIAQANDQVEESRRLQRKAKSNLMPELNVVLDYSSLSRDEEFTRAWTYHRESKWGIGFTTSADFVHANESAAYQQSIITTADSMRNAEQVRDNTILDVKRTMRALSAALEKIHLQEQQIENSRKEFHLARVKFEHGLANNFDLIQAEKNLRAAQTSLLGAIIDHKIGQFKLLASLGLLADQPKICR